MSIFERLFGSAVLDVVVPDTAVEYPPQTSTDDWLARLGSGKCDRNQAFFDEQLQSLLTIRIDHPSPDSPPEPNSPPQDLLAFLARLQISLEGTYISPSPIAPPETARSTLLFAPPRPGSFGKLKAHPNLHHPSIFPPSTPNPTPSSAEHDRGYTQSEGTLLVASIWGQNTSNDSQEAFSLLWSEAEQVWVAVYRLVLTVSFLRLTVTDPLLCLTVAATLREKPLALTRPKHPLAAFFASTGAVLAETAPPSPTTANGHLPELPKEEELDGLEEVNLLEGLSAGPMFSKSGQSLLSLPTTRLGPVSRQKLFSLAPIVPPTPVLPSPSPLTAVRTAHATLRKSFRKTLRTASGFRVRMRTVFVPYVLLPETNSGDNLDEAEGERERREAGNEERTVVLCVEIENSGESGAGVGYAVEKVDVNIGGEGATATLIGWGEGLVSKDAESKTFPLLIGSMAQYNLLYAVSFLRPPEELDGYSLTRDPSNGEMPASPELQRAVTINIHGKPYLETRTHQTDDDADESISLLYPTHTFSSRWNCVLDLSAQQNQTHDASEANDPTDPTNAHGSALPEPPSPFPVSTSRLGITSPSSSNGNIESGGTTPLMAMAGSKRHTMPGSIVAARLLKSSTPTTRRPSSAMFNRGSQSSREREREYPSLPSTPNKSAFTTQSISSQVPQSPTTYSPPIQHSDSADPNAGNSSPASDQVPPMTPAYPAYPSNSALSPVPNFQASIASHGSGNVEPSVEIRREHGAGMDLGGAQAPQTPTVIGALGDQVMLQRLQHTEDSGESIVVSVGLLPLARRKEKEVRLGPGKIYPLDYFTMDIFVFNKSTWTRRFEISCPDQRRKRRPGRGDQGVGAGEPSIKAGGTKTGSPGILPIDNRVRIGPLRPSTCQSVRMEFLAVTPGVHSIETLTLTDVESRFSMNLRSVMDIVVHEPND